MTDTDLWQKATEVAALALGLRLTWEYPICRCGHSGDHHSDAEPHPCYECDNCIKFSKADKKQNPSGSEGRRKKALLRRRDGDKCFFCDQSFTAAEPATFDHLRPRTVGGTNEVDNMVLAHEECNLMRSTSKLGRRRRPSDPVPVLAWVNGSPR